MFVVYFNYVMFRERVPKCSCIGTEIIATITGGSYLWNIGNIFIPKIERMGFNIYQVMLMNTLESF